MHRNADRQQNLQQRLTSRPLAALRYLLTSAAAAADSAYEQLLVACLPGGMYHSYSTAALLSCRRLYLPEGLTDWLIAG
jgi:hypothetical protein